MRGVYGELKRATVRFIYSFCKTADTVQKEGRLPRGGSGGRRAGEQGGSAEGSVGNKRQSEGGGRAGKARKHIDCGAGGGSAMSSRDETIANFQAITGIDNLDRCVELLVSLHLLHNEDVSAIVLCVGRPSYACMLIVFLHDRSITVGTSKQRRRWCFRSMTLILRAEQRAAQRAVQRVEDLQLPVARSGEEQQHTHGHSKTRLRCETTLKMPPRLVRVFWATCRGSSPAKEAGGGVSTTRNGL